MISITVRLPPKALLNQAALTKVIESTLNAAADGIQNDLKRPTGTWQHKPEFVIDVFPGKRIIYTADAIYRYVSGGTAVRRVVMVPGFRSKSTPGSINARKGKGGVMFGPSKKIARPGIEARNFDLTVQKKWQKEFPKQMQQAIDTAFGDIA
jgi:hypothetical protein